jgi:hypothetical protein
VKEIGQGLGKANRLGLQQISVGVVSVLFKQCNVIACCENSWQERQLWLINNRDDSRSFSQHHPSIYNCQLFDTTRSEVIFGSICVIQWFVQGAI